MFTLLIYTTHCLDPSAFRDELRRSRICSESADLRGRLVDDLAELAGDGDSCIYRIKSPTPNARIKIKLHDLTENGNCLEQDDDHIYLLANGIPYGPYCNTRTVLSRHRRYTAFTAYHENAHYATEGDKEQNIQEFEDDTRGLGDGIGLCGPCESDSDCGEYHEYWMKCGNAGKCVCGNAWVDANGIYEDGCEAFQFGYKMDHGQCGQATTTTTTSETTSTTSSTAYADDEEISYTIDIADLANATLLSELEGTFKADELDVVYVTAPGGYKFRFKFSFEWELIQMPGNETIVIGRNESDEEIYTYAIDARPPQVPQFDTHGLPTAYAAMCQPTHFLPPSLAVFEVV